jgi:hypothetical protein
MSTAYEDDDKYPKDGYQYLQTKEIVKQKQYETLAQEKRIQVNGLLDRILDLHTFYLQSGIKQVKWECINLVYELRSLDLLMAIAVSKNFNFAD